MKRKIQCSKRRWIRVAYEEASAAGVELNYVLQGDRRRKYLEVRWRAWQRLLDGGCSSVQIAKAAGFNHTTVLHACNEKMRQRRIERYKLSRPYTSPYRAYAVSVPSSEAA